MCRLAAYLGPAVPLDRLLLQPAHSLVVQATAPREMVYASHNADGFGFGWFTDEYVPARYRSLLPIWNDANLQDLAGTLKRSVWLGIVRAATPGLALALDNTGPYAADGLLAMHNGFIHDFTHSFRPRLNAYLRPEIAAGIRGNTDSEYLFALLRQHREDGPDRAMMQVLADTIAWLEQELSVETLLNLVLSDGYSLYACRHGINGACPSLYYVENEPNFPLGAQLLASEPLNPDANWQPVPEHSLIRLTPGEKAEIRSLL